MTQVIRIPITNEEDLATSIKDACDVRLSAGYRLAGLAISGSDVILAFQPIDPSQPQ